MGINNMAMDVDRNPLTKPEHPHWWQSGFMWMVLGGPAVVVVAGFTTMWLAISDPDPVIDQNYYQNGIEINKMLEAKEMAEAAKRALEPQGNYRPAIQGRNHAATPSEDVPR